MTEKGIFFVSRIRGNALFRVIAHHPVNGDDGVISDQTIKYSDAQKALMWDRWQKGDSTYAIARLFDRGHSSVKRNLSETGCKW